MKQTTTLVLLCLTFMTGIAQDKTIPDLEYIDQPYLWLQEADSLIMLTKETVKIKSGYSIGYEIKGTASNLAVEVSGKVSLLMKSEIAFFSMMLKVYKLDVKKKTRWVEVRGTEVQPENLVDFKTKSISDGLYEIVFPDNLDAGEYMVHFGTDAYTFSVKKLLNTTKPKAN